MGLRSGNWDVQNIMDKHFFLNDGFVGLFYMTELYPVGKKLFIFYYTICLDVESTPFLNIYFGTPSTRRPKALTYTIILVPLCFPVVGWYS